MRSPPLSIALLALLPLATLACLEPAPPPKVHTPAPPDPSAGQPSAGQPSAKEAAPTLPGADAGEKGREPAYCKDIRACTDCPNDVFIPTECWTTDYGAARANVILLSGQETSLTATDMLYCNEGDYALCFFSGPSDVTGDPSPPNEALPCVLDASGTFADCTCRAFTAQDKQGYFVDINAIENLRVYYQTVDACGADGSLCWNMSNYGSYDPTSAAYKIPPVCKFVVGQNPTNDRDSLIPGAELISTFSRAMEQNHTLGSTDCPNEAHLPYAGCMTAPCTFPSGRPEGPLVGQNVQCKCPTWNGPYQIGQKVPDSQGCGIGAAPGADGKTYVWSAAYTVRETTTAKP